MIRNANRNISVAKGHGYEVSKVKFAMDFINSPSRNKTLEDWVNAYNHIKGTNESAQGCQACKAAKFTAGVRNYAQYGYLTLINEGHKPEEFLTETEETSDVTCNEEKQVPALVNEVVEEEKQPEEVVEDTVKEEQPVEKKKVGRPKKVKK